MSIPNSLPAGETGGAPRLTIRAWGVVLAVYLATALAVTYPLVRHLGESTPGRPADAGLYLWCMDMFWTELGAGRSPLSTDRVLFPRGANLAHANCPTLLSLLSYPFRSNLVLYAAFVTIGSFVAASVAMMLLVRELTADDAAAAIGGLLYGLSPPLLSHLWNSQFPSVTAAALLPFGVLGFVRFSRTGSVRSLLALNAVLWALVLTNPYITVTLLIMVVAMAAILVPRRWTMRHWRRAAAVGAVNGILALLIVTWWLSPDDARDVVRGGFGFTSTSNVNLADLLVPAESNPVLGTLHQWWAFDQNKDIRSYFLGWGILALAIAATVRRRRDPEILALAVAGIVAVALACGTVIRVGPLAVLERAWTPFDWLSRLPYLTLLDAPRRLVVGASLAVVALAAVGVAGIATRSRRRRTILLGALVLGLLEYGQLQAPVASLIAPQVYRRLAAEPDERTVLELGAGIAGSNKNFGLDFAIPIGHGMFWQTVHRKPRVSGYLARVPHSTFRWFESVPIMSDILRMTHKGAGKWSDTTYSSASVREFLRTFDLGYVIIPPSPRHDYYTEVIDALLAGHVARTEIVEGYRLYVLVDDRTCAADAAASR